MLDLQRILRILEGYLEKIRLSATLVDMSFQIVSVDAYWIASFMHTAWSPIFTTAFLACLLTAQARDLDSRKIQHSVLDVSFIGQFVSKFLLLAYKELT